MSFKSFRVFIFVAPFLLTACGEGYEQIRTTEYFPYGNQRTAGSVIAFVQSSLLPERQLNVKTVSEDPLFTFSENLSETIGVPKQGEVKVLKQLEKDLDALFQKKQKK